ncbi:putative secreted lipprotein [Lasiodiplodia theobromae]|uniref:Carboxylic ester hydrolase n=1 Tax=Lasiodiplodia theobromae TaxID=45133 RepID=A0A5N5D030_9PEZI|nr:putative secreted lipprotein [Lasiodiplodia theobromae]
MRRTQALLILWAFCLQLITAFPPVQHERRSANYTSVRLNNSTIYGTISPKAPDVRSFLSIPYAAPPVGSLRWAPPQPMALAADVDATSFGLSCPQIFNNRSAALSTIVYTTVDPEFSLEGGDSSPTGEDCLTISVWAPTTTTAAAASANSSLLPVIIWVFGGAFQVGGENVPYQIPSQWVQRTQSHVVVSFNYRLNIFGFPVAAGLGTTTQNLGLLGQRAAVEWVRDNIAAFGGDPERMVIWGQSAGSLSVESFQYAYPEDPIVKGAVLDSGSVYMQTLDLESSTGSFTFVAEHFGCGGGLEPEEEVECMRGVPADEIEDFLDEHLTAGAAPMLAFQPVKDEHVVFSNYTQRTIDGAIADIPVIIGTTSNEGAAFNAFDLSGPNETAAESFMLDTVLCPLVQSTNDRTAAGYNVYRFWYDGNFTNISPLPWMGAFHCSELPLLFGTHPNFRGNSTPFEYAVSESMQDLWVEFARDPSGFTEHWPVWNPDTQPMLVFGQGEIPSQVVNLTIATASTQAQMISMCAA